MKATNSGAIVADYKCEYAWLIELFEDEQTVEGCYVAPSSRGVYVEELGDKPHVTASAWHAKRYTNEAEAKAVAASLCAHGNWKAIDHGFCGGCNV